MKQLIFISLLLVCIPVIGLTQCKGFTKKNCIPNLEPYVYNGQVNSALLYQGDIAELLLTFSGEQVYRVLVCPQKNMGNIEFKILDTERNVIFNNKEHDFVLFRDFIAVSTQQLIVQVVIPEQESESDIVQSGCVSILIGFKEIEDIEITNNK